MEIVLLPQAENDLNCWKEKGDARILKRIRALLEDILQHPFSGLGKPEALKGTNGKWSRRINDEHRLVYSISSGKNRFIIPIYLIALLTPPVAFASGVLVCASPSAHPPVAHDAYVSLTSGVQPLVW